jgi:hypothetical protein
MSQAESLNLEADYAISIRPSFADVFQTDDLAWVERTIDWTGWMRHRWPADVVAPNQLLYGFDLRKDQRRLFALTRILKGGSFSFRSMQEFAETVAGLTGHRPAPEDDDLRGRLETGICSRWADGYPVGHGRTEALPQ